MLRGILHNTWWPGVVLGFAFAAFCLYTFASALTAALMALTALILEPTGDTTAERVIEWVAPAGAAGAVIVAAVAVTAVTSTVGFRLGVPLWLRPIISAALALMMVQFLAHGRERRRSRIRRVKTRRRHVLRGRSRKTTVSATLGRLLAAAGMIGLIASKQGKTPPAGVEVVDPGFKGLQKEVLTPGTYKINPHLYSKMPFDPLKDFAPIMLVSSQPLIVVVATASPCTIRTTSGGTSGPP